MLVLVDSLPALYCLHPEPGGQQAFLHYMTALGQQLQVREEVGRGRDNGNGGRCRGVGVLVGSGGLGVGLEKRMGPQAVVKFTVQSRFSAIYWDVLP